MKPFLLHLAIALVLVTEIACLLAQDGARERKTGKVLLLRGGHVMEGEIEKVGVQMRVKNGPSEIWISADKAVRLCADWNDAYVFLQSQLKLDDANDRVRLARWCHMNRLSDKAIEQAKYALELQPGHPDALQIVTTLERALKEPASAPLVPVAPSPPRAKEPAPQVDVSSDAQLGFATRVQPILMNTCARCHCTGRGGKLELERVASPTQKAATQRNLAKMLTYIDLERPAISELLERAIKAHGDAEQPPLPNRDARAFQSLQQWIEQTIARNPHLKDYAAVRKTRVPMPTGVVVSRPPMPVSPPAPTPIAAKEAPAPVAAPAPKAAPDPFAPELFNDYYHPKR